MKNSYLLFFGFLFFWIPSEIYAQSILIPQSIITNITPASPALTPVTNLFLNINSSTNSNSEFPFSPSSTFSNDIGFVSMVGNDTGTITYTFNNPVTISQMLLWNGYLELGYEDNIRDFYITFKDASGIPVIEYICGVWHVDPSDGLGLRPRELTFPAEITGIKSIDIRTITIWGGDQIALRRIAFTGTEQTTSLQENTPKMIQTYPNPAVNHFTIPEKELESVQLTDMNGKTMEIEWVNSGEYATIYWKSMALGIYNLRVITSAGLFSSKVFVE